MSHMHAGSPQPDLVGTVTEKSSWWVAILLVPIRFYQRYLSGLLGQNCKYFPTCSSYAVQALTRHGVLKGTLLVAWRLLRCNPWSHGGSDRVPARGRWKPDPYVPPVFDDDEDGAARRAGVTSIPDRCAPSGPRPETIGNEVPPRMSPPGK